MAKICAKCGDKGGFLKDATFSIINGKDYCKECASAYLKECIDTIIITTTNNIDGYKVKKYLGIESVEIVIGTGIFSEFFGDVSDIFGARSTPFEEKLQKAKCIAIDKLKYLAYQKNGNAIIGVDIDYTEFSSNRIGVILNGTVVELENKEGSLSEYDILLEMDTEKIREMYISTEDIRLKNACKNELMKRGF